MGGNNNVKATPAAQAPVVKHQPKPAKKAKKSASKPEPRRFVVSSSGSAVSRPAGSTQRIQKPQVVTIMPAGEAASTQTATTERELRILKAQKYAKERAGQASTVAPATQVPGKAVPKVAPTTSRIVEVQKPVVVGGLEFPTIPGVILPAEMEEKPVLSKVVTSDFRYFNGPVSVKDLKLETNQYAFIREKVPLYELSALVSPGGVNLDGKVVGGKKTVYASDNLPNLWVVAREDGFHFFSVNSLVAPETNAAHKTYEEYVAKVEAEKDDKEEKKEETKEEDKPEQVFVPGKPIPAPSKITAAEIDAAKGFAVPAGCRYVHLNYAGFPLSNDARHPIYKIELPPRAEVGDFIAIGSNYLTPTVDTDAIEGIDDTVFGNQPLVYLYHLGKRLRWARGQGAYFNGRTWVPSVQALHVGTSP